MLFEAIGSLAGGIIGDLTDEDKKIAEMYLRKQMSSLESLEPFDAIKYYYEAKKYAEAVREMPHDQRQSELASLQENPDVANYQRKVLQKEAEIVDNQGIDPTSQAQLQQIAGQQSRDTAAERAAIQDSFQRQGRAGSGANLASQLSAAQGNAQIAAGRGQAVAISQEARRADALNRLFTGATGLRGQEYGIGKDRALAADSISRFNTQGRRDREQRFNTQGYNLRNANTDLTNQDQQRRLDLSRETVDNKNKIAQTKSQGYGTAYKTHNERSQTHRKKWVGIGKNLGKIGDAVAGGGGSEEKGQ